MAVLRRVRMPPRGGTVTLIAAPALRPEPGADRRSLARAAQASAGLVPSALGLAA